MMMMMMNGIVPTVSSPDPSLNRVPNGHYSPEFQPIESNNWLIHIRYVRKEFDICKLIIEEDLVRTKGCNEYANYILGLILRREGKVRESLECFQKCCFLNPANILNMLQVGRSWFLLGQKYQAVEAFIKAEKQAKSPDWNVYHNLGLCYASLLRIGKARECLTKAVHLGRAEQCYTALAELYLSENDINSALDVYNTALELFPSSSELAVSAGKVYLKVGDTARALDKFGLALAINPRDWRTLLTVASIMQEHKEFDVALSKYKIAGQMLPESVALWNNMGLCFFGKGKYVAAMSCLKRAIYLDPMDWKTLYNLGLVHIHAKQYTSAFHYLSASIKIDHRHSQSFMLLAISLQKLSDNENATKCFEQAIKLDADDITVRINFTSHLYAMNRKDDALEQLNIVQRLIQHSEIDDRTKEAVKQLTLALTHGIVAQSTELQIPSKDRQTKSDEEEELVQNQIKETSNVLC
ncbi:BBSome complex member BBS4-like isoform X2 [Rhodnius prolixus]|uniref:BBSome complex member BBS4-like isoform X2 n=2 Tax=Rhodnius prolixus TaxID=13249 RepID=UPI003D18F0D0